MNKTTTILIALLWLPLAISAEEKSLAEWWHSNNIEACINDRGAIGYLNGSNTDKRSYAKQYCKLCVQYYSSRGNTAFYGFIGDDSQYKLGALADALKGLCARQALIVPRVKPEHSIKCDFASVNTRTNTATTVKTGEMVLA